jgi:hypothetical protein
MMKEQVRVLKEVREINLPTGRLGPFEVGEEIKLWVWEAKVLERQGLVERRRITPTDVKRLIIAEERNPELEKLPENFYFSVKEEVSNLRRMGDHEKANELKSQALVLFEIRLPKLLTLALSPEDSGEIPAEEKFLINRLAFVYRIWVQNFEKFLEAGEEVDQSDFRGTI